MESLKVLELYSGIGGMHYALKREFVPTRIFKKVEIKNKGFIFKSVV